MSGDRAAPGTRAARAGSVQPLRDPAIDGYLNQAHAAETAKNYDAAADATANALKLAAARLRGRWRAVQWGQGFYAGTELVRLEMRVLG